MLHILLKLKADEFMLHLLNAFDGDSLKANIFFNIGRWVPHKTPFLENFFLQNTQKIGMVLLHEF